MALLIRERLLQSVKSYDILNENGEPAYTTAGRLKGQFIVMGHQLHVFDLQGKEVAFLHEVFPNVYGKYEIIIHGKKCGMIKGKFSLFHPKYQVDYLGYSVKGDIIGMHYQMFRKDEMVATLAMQAFRLGTMMTLNCPNPEDELASLMLAIAIDDIGAGGRGTWSFELGPFNL
jgi:uncharacterized protein YxjI